MGRQDYVYLSVIEMIYISDNYQIINNIIMQKMILSTPVKNKNTNYFIYEMKDTNQLLKDLISCNMSDTMSRSADNKEQIINQDIQRTNTANRNIDANNMIIDKNRICGIKELDSSIFGQQLNKDNVKYQDSYQNEQNELINQIKIKNNHNRTQNVLQDLILQKFYIDNDVNQQEENLNKVNNHKNNKYNEQYQSIKRPFDQYQSIKQTKKQKKGLANISLRVKNIVSEHKKLSYKQVSDLVLQYSKDQIQQLEENQKIKQIKNIKRRVYDALNVLVAMGILGKHQRCVTNTQWTNIPGKKHSVQWQNANNKIDHIKKLKRNCEDKQTALQLLMNKYNSIAALRNKHRKQEQQQQIRQKQCAQIIQKQINKVEQNQYNSNKLTQKNKQKQIQQKQLYKTNNHAFKYHHNDKKLLFPLIAICPSLQQANDKLIVDIETTEDNQKKMKIYGKNLLIFGDFDCTLELDLEKYRNKQEQEKLSKDIDKYASQYVKKTYNNSNQFKYQSNHQEVSDIEGYFNDHVFNTQ